MKDARLKDVIRRLKNLNFENRCLRRLKMVQKSTNKNQIISHVLTSVLGVSNVTCLGSHQTSLL